MIGTEMIRDGVVVGFSLTTDLCHYFFGTASCSREMLPELFPQYRFRHLRQVHGSTLLESLTGEESADAHWTRDCGVALVVQTADCLPVLFGANGLVLAAHAGWRGIENDLLVQCAEFLSRQSLRPEKILIGPHIQARDFEVGRDVANQLIEAYRRVSAEAPLPTLPHPDPEKLKVNLSQIAVAQVRAKLGPLTHVDVAPQSTFSDPLFHSFRRGKQPSARQYSFIARRA